MSILDRLQSLLNIKAEGPSLPIPKPLLLNAGSRPGISADRITRKVYERESEIFSADEPHREMYAIIIQEIVKDIQENSVIEVAAAPGTATVQGAGANAGGPVTIFGTITNIFGMKGVIR